MTQRILIVDDDQHILDTLETVLSKEGFTVRCALSVREAMDLFRPDLFDLVVTDMGMPGMGGGELIRRIKKIDVNAEVIVLAGDACVDDAVNSLKYGAFDYLTQPLEDPDQFINTVQQALAKRELLMKNNRLRERLEHLASHDPLTGLSNRRLFNERLDEAIKRARRRNTSVFVLIIDLDHFKNVNDTLGHEAGDALLVQSVRRMQTCTRETDLLSRVGGDEFFVIIEDAEDPRYVAMVAQRLIRELGRPFDIENHEARIGASIGIAAYPVDGETPETLVKFADIAMYRVKQGGRNGYQFFTKEMSEAVAEKVRLCNRLHHAVVHDDFSVAYLPVADIKTNRVLGVEALMRWNSVGNDHVGPDIFIPLMEQAGLIDSAFQSLLKRACADCKTWQANGFPNLKLSINVSPHQFDSPGFPEMIKNNLADVDFDPGLLWLEITEGLFNEEEERARENLEGIKEIGVDRIILDDFGVGFSSLRYLTKYAIDGLKIDNELIRDLNSKPQTRALVAAIVSMAVGLDLRTISAEGVEFEDQLPILREFGCTSYQGYLHSRPMTPEALSVFLGNQKREFPGQEETARILIVDDNLFNRTLLKSMLALANYQADTAATAHEALERIRTVQYDLMLLDIVLPDMDGYALSRRIRELALFDVAIVGVTAHDTEIQTKFFASGMNDYLFKPVSKEKLISTVEKWMLVKPTLG